MLTKDYRQFYITYPHFNIYQTVDCQYPSKFVKFTYIHTYRLAREISINNSGPYLTSKRSIHDVHFNTWDKRILDKNLNNQCTPYFIISVI